MIYNSSDRSPNALERVIPEIKRQSRVVRIFLNTDSCLRLSASRRKEHHEDWITGRRYIGMGQLWEREREEPTEAVSPPPPVA